MSDFPRGGAGPPQPLPKGAGVALAIVSVLAIGAVMALMAWLLL